MTDRRLCTFHVGKLLIGVDVDQVQEVRAAEIVTPVPLAPDSVTGIINLRGQIVTVIDARQRLGLPTGDEHADRVYAVIRNDGEAIGLAVDRAGDVIEVDASDFEDVPDTVRSTIRSFVSGVYKLEGAQLLVLDTARTLSVTSS
jgi:purine-binding chemotaxis protein CheW